MRSTLCLSLLLPLTVLAAQTEVPLPTDIDLTVGMPRVLKLPKISRLTMGDSAIADLEPLDNGDIKLVGVSRGETKLRVWPQGRSTFVEIRIHVQGDGPARASAPKAPADNRVGEKVADGATLSLALNEERVLVVPNMTRMAVGDSAIADVKLLGNDRMLVAAGKEKGGTTLIVWSGETTHTILLNVGK